jgi:two-component system C4-dicarboxylate transport response regulator DctD
MQDKSGESQSRKTVYLVDDERDILLILRKSLEQDGFIIHDFTDPKEALDHFLLNGKDRTLVIADVRMPTMNGFTLCRKIKESRPQVPVILMSSFEIGRSEFAKVMPHTTVDGFIQKPISMKEFKELVNQFTSVPSPQ